MERDPRSFLWDARRSADAILRFIAGVSMEQSLADELLRSAVERQFEIIGEALKQLAKISPEVAGQRPNLDGAVAFRNVLFHGYSRVEPRTVWLIAERSLPELREAITAVLAELENKT